MACGPQILLSAGINAAVAALSAGAGPTVLALAVLVVTVPPATLADWLGEIFSLLHRSQLCHLRSRYGAVSAYGDLARLSLACPWIGLRGTRQRYSVRGSDPSGRSRSETARSPPG